MGRWIEGDLPTFIQYSTRQSTHIIKPKAKVAERRATRAPHQAPVGSRFALPQPDSDSLPISSHNFGPGGRRAGGKNLDFPLSP